MLDGLPFAFQLVFGLCFIGLVGCVPVLLLTRWWSEGTVGGLESFGLFAMYAVLFALLLGPIPNAVRPLILIIMVGGTLALVLIPQANSRSGAKSLDNEQEKTYRAAIAANPGNVAARCELAYNLYRRGRVSEAIDEMEEAVRLSPKTTENEQRALQKWIDELETPRNATVICPFCREDTPANRPECLHCGRSLSGLQELADVLKEDVPGMVRTVVIGALVLIPLGFLLSILKPVFATILMFTIVVAGLWWWRSRY